MSIKKIVIITLIPTIAVCAIVAYLLLTTISYYYNFDCIKIVDKATGEDYTSNDNYVKPYIGVFEDHANIELFGKSSNKNTVIKVESASIIDTKTSDVIYSEMNLNKIISIDEDSNKSESRDEYWEMYDIGQISSENYTPDGSYNLEVHLSYTVESNGKSEHFDLIYIFEVIGYGYYKWLPY